MRQAYRLFRRRGEVFWIQNNETGKQESLRTKDRTEAERLLNAKNEATRQPVINLQIARAYLMVSDKEAATRTWQQVMNEIVKLKTGETERRWKVAIKDKALDGIRNMPILETRAEHFLSAMEKGKVSTNIYLRRLHNFSLGMNWSPVPVIPKQLWPKFAFKEKRAIERDEHNKIIARELNTERKAFYQLAWHLGAAQSDIALLTADKINWESRAVIFSRKKTGTRVLQFFDDETAAIFQSLPRTGKLFPYLSTVRAGDRATEFKQRCEGLSIKGVSLHSYRYAWAKRARLAGMPLRFAQEALGHNSKAIHLAYADVPEVKVPSLSEYEKHTGQIGFLTNPQVKVI